MLCVIMVELQMKTRYCLIYFYSYYKMYFITTFQAELEKAEALMAKPGDPERPFDFKYEARELLEKLEIPEDSEYTNAAKGIVQYLLACNHFESEEVSQSDPFYRQALEHILSLPKSRQQLYLNTV